MNANDNKISKNKNVDISKNNTNKNNKVSNNKSIENKWKRMIPGLRPRYLREYKVDRKMPDIFFKNTDWQKIE